MPLWVLLAQIAARLVLVLLLGLSVWSISIMIDRKRVFGALDPLSSELVGRLIREKKWTDVKAWAESNSNLVARLLKEAISLGDSASPTSVELAVRGFLANEKVKFEKGLTILATVGANAPFIGLFGTVLGVIHAFAALADQQGGISSVMVGISEALVATAIGLLVAIPAGVSYNYYLRRMKLMLVDGEAIKDLYLSRKF